MIDVFTETIGAESITSRPKRALMKALDGLFVVGGFSQNSQGKVGHDRWRIASRAGGVHLADVAAGDGL